MPSQNLKRHFLYMKSEFGRFKLSPRQIGIRLKNSSEN